MAKQEFFDNGYTFTKDESGTITGEGNVPAQGVDCGKRATAEGKLPGDHNGHVISAQEGGPNKSYNMTAQNGKLNQGPYKTVENSESSLAKQGYEVHTSKTAYVSVQEGGRPDAYMINDTITSPDGQTHNVNLSFQNMSPEEQAEYNQFLQENDFTDGYPNPDPLRDSMTPEEYSSLMDETEKDLPSIKDEFALDNYTEVNFDFDQESTNTNSADSVSVSEGGESASDGISGESGEISGGNDAGSSEGASAGSSTGIGADASTGTGADASAGAGVDISGGIEM